MRYAGRGAALAGLGGMEGAKLAGRYGLRGARWAGDRAVEGARWVERALAVAPEESEREAL